MSSFRIICQNCGSRAASEFSFGGEESAYPQEGRETIEANYDRVWLRDNGLDSKAERWFHSAGCRRWVTVDRDTTTNVVLVIENDAR